VGRETHLREKSSTKGECAGRKGFTSGKKGNKERKEGNRKRPNGAKSVRGGGTMLIAKNVEGDYNSRNQPSGRSEGGLGGGFTTLIRVSNPGLTWYVLKKNGSGRFGARKRGDRKKGQD